MFTKIYKSVIDESVPNEALKAELLKQASRKRASGIVYLYRFSAVAAAAFVVAVGVSSLPNFIHHDPVDTVHFNEAVLSIPSAEPIVTATPKIVATFEPQKKKTPAAKPRSVSRPSAVKPSESVSVGMRMSTSGGEDTVEVEEFDDSFLGYSPKGYTASVGEDNEYIYTGENGEIIVKVEEKSADTADEPVADVYTLTKENTIITIENKGAEQASIDELIDNIKNSKMQAE